MQETDEHRECLSWSRKEFHFLTDAFKAQGTGEANVASTFRRDLPLQAQCGRHTPEIVKYGQSFQNKSFRFFNLI